MSGQKRVAPPLTDQNRATFLKFEDTDLLQVNAAAPAWMVQSEALTLLEVVGPILADSIGSADAEASVLSSGNAHLVRLAVEAARSMLASIDFQGKDDATFLTFGEADLLQLNAAAPVSAVQSQAINLLDAVRKILTESIGAADADANVLSSSSAHLIRFAVDVAKGMLGTIKERA